jgi:hypothetical protein
MSLSCGFGLNFNLVKSATGLANVLGRPRLIGPAMEVAAEVLNGVKVRADG